jgi:hypothetical protein
MYVLVLADILRHVTLFHWYCICVLFNYELMKAFKVQQEP